MKSINVIGAGKLGRTVGTLVYRNRLLAVRSVLTRSLSTATEAVAVIGAGTAVTAFADLAAADFHLVSVPDDALADCGERLADAGVLRPGDIVFHCSGATPATVLEPAVRRGARIASIHPIKSFAHVAAAVTTFPGTYCGVEGDPTACDELADIFTRLGAEVFALPPGRKAVYHAATVLASNDLVALLEVVLRCLTHCGLDRDGAMAAVRPLVAGTLENVFALGTAGALTGPVSRGDHRVVARQVAALRALDPAAADVYRSLGAFALDIARARGTASPAALAEVQAVLDTPEPRPFP